MGETHRKCFKYAKVFEKAIFCGTMFESLKLSNCSYFGTHLAHMQMEIIFLHYLMGISIINSLHIQGKIYAILGYLRKSDGRLVVFF